MKDTEYGLIRDDWQVETLENLCVPSGIQTGPFGSLLHQRDYLAVGTPIITVEHLGENRIVHKNLPRVSKDDKERLSRYIMQKGDIVFSRVGSVDRRALVRDEEDGWLFSGRCLRVRPDKTKIVSEYLAWFFGLEVFKEYIRRIAVGATMPSLNTELLSNIPVVIPPLPEQYAIAEILGALDEKVELNNKININLKSLIWSCFKSWFIDFDPVYEKANGQRPSGIDADTEKLFPSAFKDDRPEGWNISQFRDFLIPVSNRIGNEDAPEYSATVNGLSLRDENFNKSLSKSKEKNKKIVKNNLVFGLSRQTLNFGVMKEDIGSVSQVYEIFDIDTNIYLPELLEMYIRLKMDEHIDILKPAAREGQAIDRNYLLSKPILIPDMRIQKRYREYCAPFRDKIAQNDKESRTLASLRDSLLPKLMRGEIRVKEQSMIGILAYGSLIADPGTEIERLTYKKIKNVETPFAVEYARKSSTRANAPTLVPVDNNKGLPIIANIFMLAQETEINTAKDVLYRRELHMVGDMNKAYQPPANPGVNSVQIKQIDNYCGIEMVLFTSIGVNIPEIINDGISDKAKAQLLADLAIGSVTSDTFPNEEDGIYYLDSAIKNGVTTRLTDLYRNAILQKTENSCSLEEARLWVARQKKIIQENGK